jgi:hypothetical protein
LPEPARLEIFHRTQNDLEKPYFFGYLDPHGIDLAIHPCPLFIDEATPMRPNFITGPARHPGTQRPVLSQSAKSPLPQTLFKLFFQKDGSYE